MLKYHDETGVACQKVYFLGQLGNPYDPSFHGFKSYYVVAMFFKEPIPMHILCILGLVWIWRNRSYPEFLTGEAMLLLAACILRGSPCSEEPRSVSGISFRLWPSK